MRCNFEKKDNIDYQNWVQANLSWCERTFGLYSKTDVVLATLPHFSTTQYEHDIFVIPFDQEQKVSYYRFCGKLAQLAELQRTYSSVMKMQFGLTRENVGEVRRSSKSGLYRPSDYPATLGAPPAYQGDAALFEKQVKDYIVQMQRFYEEKLSKTQKEASDTLKLENKYIKKENTKLNRYVGPYLEFIQKYGGLSKAQQMLRTSQYFQYAVRSYQEQGNKDLVQHALGIIKDGQLYAKEHHIE